MFSKIWTKTSTPDFLAQIERLKTAIAEADAVVIGAGAGLSTAAGFTYSGERFDWYDAEEKSDRRSNILIIRRYFPQIQLREFPKMAHAELVMMYPEEFCRYTEEFLTGQAV